MPLSTRLAFEFAKSAQYKGVDLLLAPPNSGHRLRPVSFQGHGARRTSLSSQPSLRARSPAGRLRVPFFRRLRRLQASVDGHSRSRPAGRCHRRQRSAPHLQLRDDPDFDFEPFRDRRSEGRIHDAAGAPGSGVFVAEASRADSAAAPASRMAGASGRGAVGAAAQTQTRRAGRAISKFCTRSM